MVTHRSINIMASKKSTGIGSPSNGGDDAIASTIPYIALVTIQGDCPILFHAWNCDAVEQKSKAKKGSEEKKTDNIESYLYRDENGHVCIPGEYLRQSVIGAAKFRQDPRSPRKSASDLFKAGVVSLTELADTGLPDSDYIDRRRVTVNHSGVTRHRPALRAGWTASFKLQIQTPEYISPQVLHETLSSAGRLIGIADFRPSFGRYQVTHFEVETFNA